MRDYKRDMEEYDQLKRLKFALIELGIVVVIGAAVLCAIYWRF